MSHIPAPVDKNATKPIYIVTILNESGEIVYIKTRQDYFNIFPTHVEIKGLIITKAKATKLSKATEVDRSFGEKNEQVNILVPVHRWVKAENISFNGVA